MASISANAARRKNAQAPARTGKEFSAKPSSGESASINDVRIGEAKERLRAREFVQAADKSSEVIEDKDSSREQRMEACLVRGKALVCLGYLVSAVPDFLSVLREDPRHPEAIGYILQLEADLGRPLTMKQGSDGESYNW